MTTTLGHGANDTETLVSIELFEEKMMENRNAIEAVLLERDKELFQRDGKLYWLSPRGPVKVNAQLLRVRALLFARFFKYSFRWRVWMRLDPPLKYFTALLHKGDWGFPLLDGNSKGPNR